MVILGLVLLIGLVMSTLASLLVVGAAAASSQFSSRDSRQRR
jgi:hypothetical protein